jgi:DNA polymerase III delta subunit
MIARRYRLIAQIIATKEENKDLWKNTKLNSFEVQKIKKYAKKYSLSDFGEIFNSLRHLDRLSKTTNSDFPVLMLDLIHQIAVRTALPKVHQGDLASSANET